MEQTVGARMENDKAVAFAEIWIQQLWWEHTSFRFDWSIWENELVEARIAVDDKIADEINLLKIQ